MLFLTVPMADIAFFVETLKRKNIDFNPSVKVLDFGCGNGNRVQKMRDAGIDAYGCDVKFKSGEHADSLEGAGAIRLLQYSPYQLPFEDQEFDCIISNAVLEHVHNKDETFAELDRILKPGGVQMHYFPSKYGVIETHIFVPFASIIQHYYYLYFWAFLGVRKPNQKGMSAEQVVKDNQTYLKQSTCYHSATEIKQYLLRFSSSVEFIEKDAFLYHHSRVMRWVARYVFRLPFMPDLFRVFRAVVVLSTK